jgi:glycosyltransferase involved in cell wall biosynthesis
VRIAEIAPPWFPVPPPGYGGIELVVSLLADGLVERGHDVTLFASGGSRTRAELVSPFPDPPEPAQLGNGLYDAVHVASAYRGIGDEFDVVHDHTAYVGLTVGALLASGPPVVHTLHNAWTTPARQLLSLVADRLHVVAISAAQRDENPTIRYAAMIHNGIDLDWYPFAQDKDDFLLFIGRSYPEKGPTVAIEIARRVGLPLAMIVKREEPFERSYWDEIVAPVLNDEVEVYERVSHERKVDLLQRARALLFPIYWSEPFGLVMIEAMACGTPVVTRPAGAAIEVVEDGVTGFVRSSLDELVDAVGHLGQCAPRACRERVARHFSAEAMVAAYERLFRSVAVA